ncbi:DMT family transporter [Mycolicibacterium fluoranthenivorans]|jgi:drug/metabolite transporter (DMT)-like permease|uniref:DMT family transporter n=1 Tax=Mycolicibacterium fluoranthenivorans TaxID=258505 RepID=A0A7G8PG33_9MYCO|nr:DMT family transporter [Mycolicibacterium fluoranthenivorans]QNJ93299.1 DMT family transporter [Mycolicibacterium fluoranthenivorans]
MAVLLALLASVCGGLADFAGGVASKRTPAVIVVALSQLAGLATAVAVLLVASPGSNNPADLVWAVGAGVCMMLGLVAFYSALSTGTMGVVAPVSALGVLVPVAWGIFHLGEAPGPAAIGGAALGIVGVVMASGPEMSGRVAARSLVLAAAAGIGFGATTTFVAEAAPGGVVWTVVVLKLTIVTLALPFLLRDRRAIADVPRLWLARTATLIGVVDVTAMLSLARATTLGYVSLVGVLASLYPVITVLLARWLLHERMRRVQQIGAAVTFVGVAILGFA